MVFHYREGVNIDINRKRKTELLQYLGKQSALVRERFTQAMISHFQYNKVICQLKAEFFVNSPLTCKAIAKTS